MRNALTHENTSAVGHLRAQLDEFYRTTTTYQSFKDPTNKDGFWTVC